LILPRLTPKLRSQNGQVGPQCWTPILAACFGRFPRIYAGDQTLYESHIVDVFGMGWEGGFRMAVIPVVLIANVSPPLAKKRSSTFGYSQAASFTEAHYIPVGLSLVLERYPLKKAIYRPVLCEGPRVCRTGR
jgi:hypothetical protein